MAISREETSSRSPAVPCLASAGAGLLGSGSPGQLGNRSRDNRGQDRAQFLRTLLLELWNTGPRQGREDPQDYG